MPEWSVISSDTLPQVSENPRQLNVAIVVTAELECSYYEFLMERSPNCIISMIPMISALITKP